MTYKYYQFLQRKRYSLFKFKKLYCLREKIIFLIVKYCDKACPTVYCLISREA